jgi:hypothetical protein
VQRTILAVILVSAAATVPAAAEWSRDRTVAGPRGVVTVQGGGSCSGGECSRSVVRAGPRGVSVRSGAVERTAPGEFTRRATTTTPRAGVVTGEGSFTRR